MDNSARAIIAGLTLSHTGSDLYRALMEGVCYEMRVNMEQLASHGISPRVLYAVGGGAASPLWLSIKADVWGRPVTALSAPEVGACGTVMLCAVSLGLYPDLKAAKVAFVHEGKTYLPTPKNQAHYEKNFAAYQRLYGACRPILAEVINE
jgi:xylulokinase